MQPSDRYKPVAFALLLAGVVAFYASGLHERLNWDWLRTHRDTAKAWVDANPLIAAVTYAVTYIVVTGLSIPVGWVLTVAGGMLFGLLWGSVLASFAAAAGATLALMACRYIFRDFARRHLERWIAVFDRGLARDGALYVILLRLTPLVPYFAINAGFGLTRLPVRTFWWATQLGMLPVTLLYLYAGTRLGEIASPREVLSLPIVAAFAMLGVLPLVVRLHMARLEAGPS
ncbi:MAG: TVP38/TMEM64 family protein [Gemmataceae bacterium]